jgi:DNA helicase HerA-like ATPase
MVENRGGKYQVAERSLGMTILGQTGFGKTAFLHNLIIDDIQSGVSVIVFDPHGDLVTDILESIPNNYAEHVRILSVSETMPFGLNLWQCDNPNSSLAVSRTVDNAILVLKSLTENIDTTTSGGKLIFHIFGALAEFERDLIR